MKSKIKYFLIPLFSMFLINLGFYYLAHAANFGGDINPHLGILFISGLFFGPYGALGAVLANMICDILRGYTIFASIISAVIGFAVSILAYKLWYAPDFDFIPSIKPRVTNLSDLMYLLLVIFTCSAAYSVLTADVIGIYYPTIPGENFVAIRYFMNFMNFSLLYTMVGMIISRFDDFSYKPKIVDKSYNRKGYDALFIIIIIAILSMVVINSVVGINIQIDVLESAVLLILLFIYIRRPITKITKIEYISITEKLMTGFVVLSILIVTSYVLIIYSPLFEIIVGLMFSISSNQKYLLEVLFLDLLIVVILIPSLFLLGYMERKIVKPVLSFSKIEGFIKENEKIESEGLLKIYSDYLENDDEMGILSRSYTNLIENNNNYIENVKTLETERERMNTELRIAHKIQQSTLPKKSINNDIFTINGFCSPAKEVGGDFYDFYELDEDNTIIIIGDTSGKGVPAALFTLIIQNSIKLLIKNELDPAKVLFEVNNQTCENNPEVMFITLFLGIYNKKTHKLTYANAGHTPPLIKVDEVYELLDIDSEIAIGVLEDYEFKNHEINIDEELILYTDGITDAQNQNHEFYGEKRLLNFLNNHKENEDILNGLIDDIKTFAEGKQQFDDITLLIMTIK